MGLCQNAFTTGGFFSHEHERIFVSSLSGNTNYKKIIEYLSNNRFATREAIVNHIKAASGGTVSSLLQDLEICGFITKHTPFNLAENSLLARYSVSDVYNFSRSSENGQPSFEISTKHIYLKVYA